MEKPKLIFTTDEKQNLVGWIFRGSCLDSVDFSEADLREARFIGVSLCGSDFSDADLRGTVFVDCDLRWAHFERANFENNWFMGSWLTGAEGISHALFEYMRVRGGHFAYC
jgi:uncharacterized protein YjbI with pentapeptide repeats